MRTSACTAFAITACLVAGAARAAPTCPLSYGTTDAAKSHKLYLYFPTTDDTTYPFSGTARHFDVSELDSSIGTTAALRDRLTIRPWRNVG